MADEPETVDNPFFARLWSTMSAREPESIRELRRENLGRADRTRAGGRCGHRHQLRVLPADGHRGGRRRARAPARGTSRARPPRTRSGAGHGHHRHRRAVCAAGEPFDAVVCSLVLCSVADPDDVLRQLFSMLRPGGELRYLEHVASTGMRARIAAAGRRHGVAAAAGQLPHPPRTPSGPSPRPGSRSSRRPPRVGAARSGCRCRSRRPRSGGRSGRSDPPDGQLSSAGRRCSSLGSAVAAVSRRQIVALSDSGVRSGLTSMTGMPSASASSGSPAAG